MKVILPVILAVAAALTACYPESISDAETSDFDVVTTFFDKEASFNTITTFALPDSVVHFVVDSEAPALTHQFDDLILSKTRENLLALGYVETTDPATTPPDVVVQIGVTASKNFGYLVYDWWGYWGWYYPWYPAYGPGWGVGYPSYAVPYEYETGTVLTVMIDRRRQDPTQQVIPAIWTSALIGLLGASTAETPSRLTQGIDQAFAQSPYLRTQ